MQHVGRWEVLWEKEKVQGQGGQESIMLAQRLKGGEEKAMEISGQ